MSTHTAVQMVAKRAPLQLAQVPTVQPEGREVLVKVYWMCSTPLDLHQADGGLVPSYPNIVGDGVGGVVVETGSDVKNLVVGDKVFGFGWRFQKERGAQEYATIPENLLGKLPPGNTLQEAITLPNNFVTVFHAFTKDLNLPLTWPRPESAPKNADQPILIWGASSSVGFYAIQILTYYGYTNIIGTASKAHHAELKSLGAAHVFDYREKDVAAQILSAAANSDRNGEPAITTILDCIGSVSGSLAPISHVAQKGSTVAVLLPVIVRDATETVEPEYSWDVAGAATWEDGVVTRGVRTHFYLENELWAEKLQSEIMPFMLQKGIVKANRQRIVEGETLLARAQNALDILRRKEVSGERLVWRVAEEEN